jgi:hypothetical protein
MKTGLTATSESKFIFGPGEVFINFDEEHGVGTPVGATRGDATFNLGRVMRNIEVAGTMGPVKGLTKRETVTPTLQVQLMEITAANLKSVIAGAVEDEDGNIVGGEIAEDSYLDNVALVAEDSAGNDCILILYNVLATSVEPVAFPGDRTEALLNVTFTAHFDPSTPAEEPWKIIPVAEGS